MLLTVLDKLLINIFTRVSRMCWYSLAARISTKLIQIIMVIILSWSNLEIGVYSYVSNDHFKDLKAEYSFSKTRSHIVQNTEPEQFKSELSSKMQKTYTVLNQQRQRVHYEQKDIIHNGVLEETYQREKYNNSITEKSEKAWNSKSEENNRMLNTSISNIENIYPTSESTHFGTENSTLVTTQIGATALLPCTVHQIGEGVVSWIRRKDYHLLTVGLTTYSSDERFSTSHLKHTEDWTLQIKFVQQRDAGIYECQISTHPPTSIFLYLEVVEARAEISGPSIRYLTPGSTLRLNCIIVQNTEISEYIFWYHDNRMINYDSDRGINVSTDPDFQSSELVISVTRREHSGNYTCVASNAQPASVLVHIFKGDNPAAMYHGHVGSSTKSYQIQLSHIVIAVIYYAYVKRKFYI